MRKWTYVGSHSHRHARRDLLFEFLHLHIEHLMFARALLWGGCVIGKIFKDGESRHRENLLFLHQPHGLVAQLVGMVDQSHSRLCSEKRPWLSRGMHGYAPTHARRLFYGGFQLRLGVLIRRREFSLPN